MNFFSSCYTQTLFSTKVWIRYDYFILRNEIRKESNKVLSIYLLWTLNMNVSYEISQEQEQEAPHIFHNIFKRSSFRNQNIYSTEGCTVWHIFPSWKIGIGIEESSVLICITHYQCCEINFHISLNKLLENRLSFRKINRISWGKK